LLFISNGKDYNVSSLLKGKVYKMSMRSECESMEEIMFMKIFRREMEREICLDDYPIRGNNVFKSSFNR